MANSVLRRYTPPTCTLEISAKGSALSRWTDRPVLKNLRFQLGFDDPRLPEDQQVTVRGDRAELETLADVVSNYVQNLLDLPPDEVPIHSLSGAAEPMALRSTADVSSPLTYLRPSIPAHAESNATNRGMHLEAKGLTQHVFWLGSLANAQTGDKITLSTLQLFDLANALDDYGADSLALPSLGRPQWLTTTPGWAKVAAMLVLALGVTSVLGKFIVDLSSSTVQTASAPAESNEQLAEPDPSDDFNDEFDDFGARLPDAGATPAPGFSLSPLPSLSPSAAPNAPRANVVPIPQTPRSRPTNPSGGSQPRPATPPGDIRPLPPLASVPPQAATAPPQAAQGSGAVVTQIPDIAAAPAPNARGSQPSAPSAEAFSSDSALTTEAAPSQAAGSSPTSTAFDSLPQVLEARTYLQQRWTPPDTLTQTLEYRLSLNEDGSVKQITPLGEPSRLYVDRTNLPLIGEPFVSPFEPGQSPVLRVVLSPDGRVRTFLEALN